MNTKFEFYSPTYDHFSEEVYQKVREETYGEDIGQNSWITADEYLDLINKLSLTKDSKVLEIASGSGGPAIFLVKQTGCKYTGTDLDQNAILSATELALRAGLTGSMKFIRADSSRGLAFLNDTYDIVLCMDSINHIKERENLFRNIFNILNPGGKFVFTDPVVITGICTSDELVARSSIGYFLFAPSGINELLLAKSGFDNIESIDATENIISVSKKWYDARSKYAGELKSIESAEYFEGVQSFLNTVYLLTSERRLSRTMYIAEKLV